MSTPKFPTREEFDAIKARVAQAKHLPSGLALGDSQRLQLFADLEQLIQIIDSAVEPPPDPELGLHPPELQPAVIE